MKIHKKYIAYLILLMFFLYGINNFVFERRFFFNEILAFLGILLFLKKVILVSNKGKITIPHSLLYKTILVIIALGIFQLLVSLFTKTNWYFYFRNSVIVYSIFTFFLCYYLYPYLNSFLTNIRSGLRLYMIYALYKPSIALLERFMGTAFFPFLFKKNTFLTLLFVFLLDILLAIRYESLTVIIVTFLLIMLLFIQRYVYFKAIVISLALIFILFFITFIPAFQQYKTHKYSLFGDIRKVTKQHFLLRLDGNSTWRAVFWYRLTIETFPNNIIGIGFGTPLLPYIKGIDSAESTYDDEHDAHVMGAHNTYLTVATRLGFLFWLCLLLIYRQVFREFYLYRKYYFSQTTDYWLMISFFSVSIVGLFNLVLESPTGASLYWGLLGFVAQAIEQRKAQQFVMNVSSNTTNL